MTNYIEGKIGKLLGRGADSAAYMYGDDQVIKFSRFSWLLGPDLHKKLKHDYDLSRRYLGDYVVKTRIVSGFGDTEYIEIQNYIDGEPFAVKHAQDPELIAQLKEIVEGMQKMVADGYAPLDLVGSKGMFSSKVWNVLVDESGKLHIIDATLFELDSVPRMGKIVSFFWPLVHWRQRHILRKLLPDISEELSKGL